MISKRSEYIIAESSTNQTEWVLLADGKVVEHAFTDVLNPYFLSRREISHCVRLQLPKSFLRRRWRYVYFYGAGCGSDEKKKMVELSLVAQFKTPTKVESDLVGTARGLLIDKPGLACILGDGSNSCFYNGEKIVKNVRPCGFILGDEGSGSAIGRLFLSDLLKGLAPAELAKEFLETHSLTPDDIMTQVYNNPMANRNLANFSLFLADKLNDGYVRTLVSKELARFFERNILQYKDYQQYPLCFSGPIAVRFSELLTSVAERFGLQIQTLVSSAMPGLIKYHTLYEP